MSELRVMSFNIWRSGGRSLGRTIDAIRQSKVDVVGLQECSSDTAEHIASSLGFGVVHDLNGHAILSPHRDIRRIGSTRDVWGGLGATITLPGEKSQEEEEGSGGRRIHFFDAHLHWDKYGPYFLKQGKSQKFILEQEHVMRMPGLRELFELMDPLLASSEPTFLVGDFNVPSHLDYESFGWPQSLACYERGLVDSYRATHPENRTWTPTTPFAFDEPGITWTPLVSEEPHSAFDRIDFIYYTPSNQVSVTKSMTLDGNDTADEWPSDHRAVISTFAMR